MPRISERKKLENFIKGHRVVQMKDLFQVVQSTSRMTVYRRLSGIAYLCSYTHAGRYYTHRDIPQFNRYGLWFYDDIGFSENGSLKKTVTFLVNNSGMGRSHADLERQLRIRVHNVLLDLVRSMQIDRVKVAGQYLYLSTDQARRKEQIEKRDKLSTQAGLVPDDISELIVIEVLAEIVRQSERHPGAPRVASALALRGVPVAEKDVRAVFDHYEIEKKTPDSR
ncbi:MAG: hypothetical protein ACE5DO_14715 [Desulfobacterales bacterium]